MTAAYHWLAATWGTGSLAGAVGKGILPTGSPPSGGGTRMTQMPKHLSYISRAKLNELREQLDGPTLQQQRSTEVRAGEGLGSDTLFGLAEAHFVAASSWEVRDVSHESVVQDLTTVVRHIKGHEKVIDLAELCRQPDVHLDAFAYTYSGRFFTVAGFHRSRFGGIYISQQSLWRASDEIAFSKKLLLDPARVENSMRERAPGGRTLVSNMCILESRIGEFTLHLACSLKYFSDMGGHWHQNEEEWEVMPHSLNYRFFDGEAEAWLDGMLFLNGIRGTTIMGTPLFLIHRKERALRI